MPWLSWLTQQIRSFNRPAKLFLLATVLYGVIFSAWNLFFNFYILEQGFSRQFLGTITSVTSVAALVLGVPLGVFSDRIGRKKAMLLGMGVYIAASILQVTVTSPGLILAAAFISGTGSTLYYLSQAPFMMKASNKDNRTMLFSLNFGLVTLSGAVGNLFAGQLPNLFGQWLNVPTNSSQAYQAILLTAVLLGSSTLIPLAMIREPGNNGARSEPNFLSTQSLHAIWSVLTQRITLQLSIPNLFVGFGAALLIPYMNVFFRDKFVITDQSLGLLFSLSALLTGLGTLIGPRLAINLGSKINAIVITQGLSLVFLLVVGFAPTISLAAISFLLRGALMNMATPLYSAFAMEQVTEAQQATVNSVKELSWQVGWAFGPLISGIVQVRYGFTPLFICTAVLYALAILFTWLFFSQNERKTGIQPSTERKYDELR